ncbi:hypothetical protein BaRGS_00006190 [Batillaria attramentaria]|uniref:palmitoyl-CoA hydrolase n=1 Tax=Batillaria attramentaria TaxID=370345 RepID=A0ABD0LSW7_9CAEN
MVMGPQRRHLSIILLSLTALRVGVSGQRGVVFVHGILSGPDEFDTLHKWISADFPDLNTTSLDAWNNMRSVEPMWRQVPAFQAQFLQAMESSPDGVVLICFSQGGLICRALLSLTHHNVETMIALSSPLAGQYGDTKWMQWFFHDIVQKDAYKILYTKAGQEFSVGNYWNDPHHHDMYLKEVQFLPLLNNETYNPNSTEYKQNFLRLKNLVLVGGPDDGIIGPWQSSQFQFYDKNDVVQPMANQTWYKNDAFGLRTLAEQGRIHSHVFPNIYHTHWPRTHDIYLKCIQPWLKPPAFP